MFTFKNKVVYLISPEKWGPMKVSKHHYALELAKRNCRIFFIEPPSLLNDRTTLEKCPDHPNVTIVRYKIILRGRRFFPSCIFNQLIRLQIFLLKKKIGSEPDVIWSFHPYLFNNLNFFGAPRTLYFAADQFYYNQLPGEVVTANAVFAVSESIFKRIRPYHANVSLIGHGLDPLFVSYASTQLTIPSSNSSDIIVGYSGNLRMSALDRHMMTEIISTNKDVRFIFWGSYLTEDSNLGEDEDDLKSINTFITFLKDQRHVVLRGVLPKDELLKEMSQCSFFWICWKLGSSLLWDGSNAHKILEYLAIGKPVVSHYMSDYRDTGLLYMLNESTNEGYIDLFNHVKQIIKNGERDDLRSKRLRRAMISSYAEKLNTIEQIVCEI